MTGKRAQNRSAQQARILDVARDLFSRRGPEDVTMADVASEAGVARATVFNHFGSKHALVEAITGEVTATYEAMLETALAHKEIPVPDLVRALFEQMGTGIEADPRFYRSVFREMAKLQLGFDERGSERSRSAGQALAKLLRRGQQSGQISEVHAVEDLTRAFDALANGTITTWLYGDSDEPLHVRMRRAAEIFLAPVALESKRRVRPLPLLSEQGRLET